MGRHLFFLFLYVISPWLFSAEVVCGILVFHCVSSVLIELKDLRHSINLMMVYNVGVTIITYANLLFIQQVRAHGTGEDSIHIYNYIDMRYIDEATQLWAIGNGCIFVGYQLFIKRSLPSIEVNVTDKKSLDNIFYFIIGMVILNLTGHGINLSFIAGGFEKILLLLGIVGILFYARLWVTENNPTYGRYAITLCVINTVLALLNSYIRVDLIMPFATLVLGYFIGKGEIKYLFSYRLVPVVLVFGIFTAFFQTLGGNRAHFIDAFRGPDTQESGNGIRYIDNDEGVSGTALERSSCVAQMSNVIRLTKEKGFYNGTASFPLIAALVPKFLYKDKKVVQLGAWFAVEIEVATIGENGRANNNVNMSIPGELYLDFGYTGVVIGCLLFGAFMALFWNASRFTHSAYNLTGTLWGGYLLQCAIGTMGSDLQILVSLTSTYIVFFMMKKFADQYAVTQRRASLEGQ